MASQVKKEKKLKRLIEKNHLSNSLNDSGIELCEKEIQTPPLTPVNKLPKKETAPPVNICWAPKRPRMISSLNKADVVPIRLFQDESKDEENKENDESRKSPEPKPMNREQVQRLMLAPRRPNIPRPRNRALRPIRLFQNMDQGYITDEDPQSEGSENNFSFSPGKFANIGMRHIQF